MCGCAKGCLCVLHDLVAQREAPSGLAAKRAVGRAAAHALRGGRARLQRAAAGGQLLLGRVGRAHVDGVAHLEHAERPNLRLELFDSGFDLLFAAV